MCKLDKDLMKATVSLKGMTEKQVECLKVFMDCKPLVEWVRESMKSMFNNLLYFSLKLLYIVYYGITYYTCFSHNNYLIDLKNCYPLVNKCIFKKSL